MLTVHGRWKYAQRRRFLKFGGAMKNVSRREFLRSVAAVGAGAVIPAHMAAQSSTSVRIDVHHHIVPPALIQAWGAQRMGAASANWTPSKALEELEQGGVSAGMTSIAPAGDPFDDPTTAVRLSRECDDCAPRLAPDPPLPLALSPSLPL